MTDHIPVVPLNYTVLCNGTSYDRDTVELSVREVLHAIAKALASNKSVNVDFPKIGRLLIREKKAHMKFFKEFVRSMESSGNPQVAFVSCFIIINYVIIILASLYLSHWIRKFHNV